MHLKLPVVLLGAFALIAPSAMVDAKDKGKDKNKDAKHDKHDKSADRKGGHGGDDSGRHHDGGDGKITICHIPPGNPSKRHTISVGESAWSAHQGHGDHRGACGRGNGNGQGGRFDALDLDDDGRIALSEWNGDRAGFARLDRNDDGYLSRAEFSRR